MLGVKNIRLLDPKSGRDGIFDLLFDQGRVKKIGRDLSMEGASRIIDGTGLTAGPGLIDGHVHFRDPGFTYKEDIESGSAAAKRGGFTTVILMANTKPAVDNPETLAYVLEKGRRTGIHVESCGAVTKELKGKELTDMEALAAAGAVGFTDDGIPLMDEKLLTEALTRAAALDMPVSLHEEDPNFVFSAGVNQGKVSEKMGLEGAAAAAENVLTARDCMLALHTGAAVNIQHISSKEAVELVRTAKKLGARVAAEVTPHHFTLTEEAVLAHKTLAKMNPPLRTEEDRQALIKGLQDGTIDMIVTDHAPHSREEKEREFTKAPSGIIGLETSFGLGYTVLVKNQYLSLMELFEKMSLAPARFYHLDAGYVAEGGPGDLVIFDEKEEWTAGDYASKADNSPFTGWKLSGKIKYTICGGQVVFEDSGSENL